MDYKDVRKVTRKQIDIERLDESEIVHDYEGKRYLVNDQYMDDQIVQRQNSPEKEIAIAAVRRLLHSDVKELTDRQKDVMIGIMEGKTLREIAEDLQLHFSTVQEHVAIAKKRLERLINQTKSILKEEQDNGTSNTTETDINS